uniref:PUB domain-containing protein n=1 Tax=Caenorhabditis tropicalis TaxID=1561998 RepID=A0A1I7UM37_9PELO
MCGWTKGNCAAELTLEFTIPIYESLKTQNVGPDKLKEVKETIETMRKKLDKSDPWVTFRNERMRYSKFLGMDRKKCSVYKVRANEYIAFDAEELQNGLDALGVSWNLEEHTVSLEDHFGDDSSDDVPKEITNDWMEKCNKIAETGKAVAEVIEKGEPSLDPRVLLLAEKRKERNRKTRENKKMKKAKEKKGVHVEIIDEQEV